MLQRSGVLALASLGGCYAELGLGYGGSTNITGHASVGLVAHFGASGQAGSVRAGAGVAIAGYETPQGREGSVSPGPVVVGGHARLAGSGQDTFVVTADVHEPHLGSLRFSEPDATERTLASRLFVGAGYRHSWHGTPRDESASPRESGSVILGVGPEVFVSRDDVYGSTTEVGGAVSIVFALRAWTIGEMFDCLTDKHGCEK